MFSTNHTEKRVHPRILRTHKLLNQAFFELMAEKSFQSITIQEIADRATVNRATFYAHFEDKLDLLDSYIREGFRDWMAERIPSSAGFDVEQLQRIVMTVFEFLARMDARCSRADKQIEPMFETAVQEELSQYLLGNFKQNNNGQSTFRHPPEIMAMTWSWAVFGAGIQWSRGARSLSAQEMAAQVVDVLTAPVSEPGQAHISPNRVGS